MASSYSPNLKFELPANGDQSGTWGTTVNNNTGTLIEQAIVGIQNITLSTANYVLSNLNGVSDEARNAVLTVSGTPGASRNLLVPNGQTKIYIVVNNTTGGFNVGVQTWSGSGLTGTGAVATVPPGASIQVYCTGTNCYAIAPFTSITAVPVVFTGYASGTTLTVTSAPTAPILAGQTIYNSGILYTPSAFPTATTIVSQTSGTTGGVGVYVITTIGSNVVGNVNNPQPITALATLNQIATVDYVQNKTENIYLQGAPTADTATAAAFEGTIPLTTIMLASKYYIPSSAYATNALGLGQYVNGTNVSDGTYISAWGTGTAGNSVFTGYISGTTLTVVSTTSGAVTSAQYLTANGTALTLGTKITGGSGASWTVSISQTLGSAASPVTFNGLGPILNATDAYNRSTYTDYRAGGWVTVQNDLQAVTVASRVPMLSYTSPLQLANVLWASNITSVVGTLGTQSDTAVSILGGNISNAKLTNCTGLSTNYVSVKDYGATGNGTTDDTAAINACITANGGTGIFFPSGTYLVSGSGISAAYNNISLVGAGMYNTIIKTAAATTAAITMGSGSAMTNQTVDSFTIDCTLATTTCTAFRANNCSNFLVNNLNIIKANIGIRIQFGTLQTYTNFRITDSTAVGIKFEEGGNDYSFTDGELVNNSTQPTTAGLWVTQATNAIRMTNVGFIRQNTAVLIAPGAGYQSTWHFFNGIVCDTCSGSGISLVPTGTGKVLGVSIIGSWTASSTVDGITIGSSGTVDGVIVTGHRSYVNGRYGYNVASSTCTNISFNGCEAFCNSVSASNTYSGFYITGGTNKISIQGCSSGIGASFTNLQFFGIEFALGATTNYMVIGNMLQGNGTGGFSDATSPTTASKVIANNL